MDTHLFQKIGACMLLSFASLFSYAEKLPLQVEMNLQNGAINQLKVEKDKTEMNWLIKKTVRNIRGSGKIWPGA